MEQYEHVNVKFTVEPQVLTQQKRPCVIYQEIRFAEPINIELITFRNFYCAFVTIHKYNDNYEVNTDGEWITILENYQLMKNGHYENDAQNTHIIHNSQFIKNNPNSEQNNKTSALRFYLIQPSSNWTSFGLRDLMCYTLKTINNNMNKYTIHTENKENNNNKVSETTTDISTQVKQLDIHEAALLFRQMANETET
eukprot:208875_1